jgi:hypothetical protein
MNENPNYTQAEINFTEINPSTSHKLRAPQFATKHASTRSSASSTSSGSSAIQPFGSPEFSGSSESYGFSSTETMLESFSGSQLSFS